MKASHVALSAGMGLAALAVIGVAASPAATTPARHATTAHPVATVLVYLPDADSDGDPIEVARASISDVSHCTGRGLNVTCRARLDGYNRRVFVAGVDFPRAAAHAAR